jgi:3-hydroxyacyl-[acyl-carrier-protein] dehydratase
MIVQEDHIQDYIPQRPPMVMVHALQEVHETFARTQFTIREENIFVKDGLFQEPGLIENIAQTAAVHAGYFNKQSQSDVKIGYIAAIKSLQIHHLPKLGATIETLIEIKNVVMNVVIAEGRIFEKDVLIAQGEIRIFNQQ